MRYSFLSLVTDRAMHDRMRASAEAAGFSGGDCEFLAIDNTGGNAQDAFAGLNALLSRSRGDYAVCLHQDVTFDFDGRDVLETRLEALTSDAPRWAVCGVAGCAGPHDHCRISDRFGADRREGALPARVDSPDECFLLLRRDAGLRFSTDVGGFHFYGADICLMAEFHGHTAHAIDFHIAHHGAGSTGPVFEAAQQRFVAKWSRATRSRHLRTMSAEVLISGALPPLLARIAEGGLRMLTKLRRRPVRRARRRAAAEAGEG